MLAARLRQATGFLMGGRRAYAQAQYYILQFQFKRVHKLSNVASFSFLDYLRKVRSWREIGAGQNAGEAVLVRELSPRT